MTTVTSDAAIESAAAKNPDPAAAFGLTDARAPLRPLGIVRREPLPKDVEIDILYCGVCHSDIHTGRDEWRGTIYPCVPGHEIIGRVARVGGEVTTFAPGDLAAVGCMVDSCRSCERCRAGLEQYCAAGPVLTYNGRDRHLGGHTYGGYSTAIVVDQAFVLHLPPSLGVAAAAPLLCAGITTYSPLRHWKVGPGQQVGIVGLGGLGHMGVKFARAFGAHVTLFTTSPKKAADALALGAHDVVVSKDAQAMRRHRGSLDFILDTVSASHDIDAYLSQLRADGTLVLVGAPSAPLPVAAFSLIPSRRSFAGSTIGGIAETQEMLTYCAEQGIASEVEVIPMQRIDEAWERMLRQDVRYRFVIDMASLRR